jgi:CheY-like chemotaxis protein
MVERALPTILLVEDELADATLLMRGFQKIGVLNPIVNLRSGDDALGYLSGTGDYADRVKFPLPVLVLLDLKLPGTTGLQLLQWMRTRRDVKRIPVVVLTMDEAPSTINAAYDLGANSYLVKPGNTNQIERTVKAIQAYWIELNEPPGLVMRASEKSE